MTIPHKAAQADKTLWCVNIKGPDDIVSAPDHLSAVRMANKFNAWWLDLVTKTPLTDNHPRMWAEPIEWPYSEGHGEDVTDPDNEYHWLRELASLPFLQGVKVKELTWREYEDEQGNPDRWDAVTSTDVYYFIGLRADGYTVSFDYSDIGTFISLEAAKAAAQADYDARIRSSIEPAPSPRVSTSYEARICKGIPTDCCDYGVVDLSAGIEVCRVWKENDARRIAELLNGDPSPRAQALEEAAKVAEKTWPESGPLDMGHGARIAAAIRALSSQPVADGWLPIETAPKDGGFLAGNSADVWAAWHYDSPNGHARYGSRGATHWRPLPSSPGVSE